MTTSKMTDGQINRVVEIFRAKLVKHASNLPSDAVQAALGDASLGQDLFDVFQRHVEVHLIDTQPHLLQRKPFNPKKFIGAGWKVIEVLQPRNDGILDASQIVTKDYLKKGESSINGEERLRRIKASPADVKLQLDAADCQALYEEKGQVTLRWLDETKGIKFLSGWNTILQSPRGNRCVLYLVRRVDGSWRWSDGWVGGGNWDADRPAGLLAS
ncbi:MAG: hypothetical protein WCV85_02115 [Patescibacteria group bacterium]